MELILVRHGLPERSQHTANPPLSDIGRTQAMRVANHLQRETIAAVWSSTMRRAIETAEPLAGALDMRVQTHAGLCEYDKNDSHYVPEELLQAEDPAAWNAMVKDVISEGSSYDFKAFQGEVVAAMEYIIRKHPGERVAVFCHGGVINIWTAHVLNMPTRLFFSPRYTSLNRFDCARGGARSVRSLNEFSHLVD